MEWLAFVSSGLHKTLGALFNPAIMPVWKENQLALSGRRCNYPKAPGDCPYLRGKAYTVADASLFTIPRWTKQFAIDMGRWPALIEYRARDATPRRSPRRGEGLTG
jgi:glutathione S-transferase